MRCLVALGSNLGDRHGVVRGGLAELGRLPRTRLLRGSRPVETPPERPSDGGPFVNAVALLESDLSPRQLLAALLSLERRFGRKRGGTRGPRTLDLDLILYGVLRHDEPGLIVPHPRFRERAFVVEPAAEVAPHLRDPVSGRTMGELAERVRTA